MEEEAKEDEDETPPAEGRDRTGTAAAESSTIATGVATKAVGCRYSTHPRRRRRESGVVSTVVGTEEEKKGRRTDERG